MKQVDVWQKMVVNRRRRMAEQLNGRTPVETCGHPLGSAAYCYQPWWDAPMSVTCVACQSAPDTEGFPPFYPEKCEACGEKPPGANGVTETYIIEKPLRALPGFRGELVTTSAVVCDDCAPEVEEWSAGQWRLEAVHRLWVALTAGGPVLAVPTYGATLGSTGVICGIHRLGIEQRITSMLCWEEHLRNPVTSCSVCGDFVSLDHVTEAFSIGEHAPLAVVYSKGGPIEWWAGTLLVEPFAYVCERHLAVWKRHPMPEPAA